MTAIISEDGQYRYALKRGPNKMERVLLWCMLNPSTADSTEDDPTIRRVQRFTQQFGYDGLVVVNLFGLRSTDPNALRGHPNPIGPENDYHVEELARMASAVVCAWGGHPMAYEARQDRVCELLSKRHLNLYCLGKNANGTPKHPLYLRNDTPLEIFR